MRKRAAVVLALIIGVTFGTGVFRLVASESPDEGAATKPLDCPPSPWRSGSPIFISGGIGHGGQFREPSPRAAIRALLARIAPHVRAESFEPVHERTGGVTFALDLNDRRVSIISVQRTVDGEAWGVVGYEICDAVQVPLPVDEPEIVEDYSGPPTSDRSGEQHQQHVEERLRDIEERRARENE